MSASHVLHRVMAHRYPLAVQAEACEIVDSDGKRYIDGTSGAAVSCVGHRHPDVIAAMHAQIDRLDFAHTSFFSSTPAEELADDLIAHAPAGFRLCQIVCGGSEAIEASMKMARQYHVERGEPDRRIFIAREQSYHGSTLGALSLTGRRGAREPFEPLLMPVARVSSCFEYRGRDADESAEAYGTRLAAELEAEIVRQGPANVAAFVAETVVGATLGAVPPVPGYFRQVREICDRHGVLLILDEVMAGMGRTGSLHACEQEGVVPDLMTVAKGLGGGYAPIGAILVGGQVAAALTDGSGAFRHGHTYLGHPLSCAAALAVQKVIRRDGLLANVRLQGARLDAKLRDRLAQNPHVGDIRGRGLLRAVELVADREDKRPFPAAFGLHARVKRHALAAGLMVYPMPGAANGVDGDHVMIAPPYVVDSATIDEIAARLGDAIDAALAELPVAETVG